MNVDTNPSWLTVLLNSLGLFQKDFAKKRKRKNRTKQNINIKISIACGYIMDVCLTIIHIHGFNIISQNSISPVTVTM